MKIGFMVILGKEKETQVLYVTNVIPQFSLVDQVDLQQGIMNF